MSALWPIFPLFLFPIPLSLRLQFSSYCPQIHSHGCKFLDDYYSNSSLQGMGRRRRTGHGAVAGELWCCDGNQGPLRVAGASRASSQAVASTSRL
ncbi:hypothetical protein SETIT_1G074900v2 [Setaria italica]|uniref:Secreted protein n=2 Tax=Setaria TaxID=4554 RepID=A0A368PHS1_SETIT|nr:hypothetical protein SETIT_1G074900v2 [Setaria italica]TKW37812.1 hypothetical protein SEVIR_1G073200v2 [Setaria viridis]